MGWNNRADAYSDKPTRHFMCTAKLTPTERNEIQYRRGDGEKAIDLAVEYGVSRGLIDSLGRVYR